MNAFFLSVKKCLHADITTIHCTCVQRFKKQHTKKGKNTIHCIGARFPTDIIRYTTSVQRFPTLYDTLHQCEGFQHCTIHISAKDCTIYISAEDCHTVRYTTSVQRFPTLYETPHQCRGFPHCAIHYISAEASNSVRYTTSVQRFPTLYDTLHQCRSFPRCTIHFISAV